MGSVHFTVEVTKIRPKMMDGWGTLYKWLVAVILCGGLLGGLPNLSCKMQVLVVCNVLVARKLSRPSILLIAHLALSGETHKIVLPYSMWLC